MHPDGKVLQQYPRNNKNQQMVVHVQETDLVLFFPQHEENLRFSRITKNINRGG